MRSLLLLFLLFFCYSIKGQIFSIVKDINSNPGGGSNPSSFTRVNNLTFFLASPDGMRSELYVTDGTEGGTRILTSTPANFIGPNNLFGSNGILYFTTSQPNFGVELWKSDGSVEGTKMVKDINPGLYNSMGGTDYVEMNGVVYFTAGSSNTRGGQLWRTDGTEEGTYEAVNLWEEGSSIPSDMVILGNKIIFHAEVPPYGRELYCSDGTNNGTFLLKDIRPGIEGSQISSIVSMNGDIYILVRKGGSEGVQQIWKTDGTVQGTILIKSFPETSVSIVGELYTAGNFVFFTFNDGIHGIELWKTDGTLEGTTLLKDINSNPYQAPNNLTAFNNILYFGANNGTYGYELWRSDGSENGTFMVKDIHPFSNSYPQNFFQVGNQLLFSATTEEGQAIFRTDGTEAGTYRIQLIDGSVQRISSSSNFVLASVTTTQYGSELWAGVIGTVLPLAVSEFKATKSGNNVQLMWHTSQATNVKEFFIERSENGMDFNTIGSVPVTLAFNDENRFSFLDNIYFNNRTYFYRLRIIDHDGKYTYSKIVSIRNLNINGIIAAPNPAISTSLISFESSNRHMANLKIIDHFGNLSYQQKIQVVSGVNHHLVDFTKFAAGIYNVIIESEIFMLKTKIIKIH